MVMTPLARETIQATLLKESEEKQASLVTGEMCNRRQPIGATAKRESLDLPR
jgi:hypothetical protein